MPAEIQPFKQLVRRTYRLRQRSFPAVRSLRFCHQQAWGLTQITTFQIHLRYSNSRREPVVKCGFWGTFPLCSSSVMLPTTPLINGLRTLRVRWTCGSVETIDHKKLPTTVESSVLDGTCVNKQRSAVSLNRCRLSVSLTGWTLRLVSVGEKDQCPKLMPAIFARESR